VLTLIARDVLTTDATPTTLAFTRGVKPVVTELRIDRIDDVNLYVTGPVTAMIVLPILVFVPTISKKFRVTDAHETRSGSRPAIRKWTASPSV
jgi:hypothetical protein